MENVNYLIILTAFMNRAFATAVEWIRQNEDRQFDPRNQQGDAGKELPLKFMCYIWHMCESYKTLTGTEEQKREKARHCKGRKVSATDQRVFRVGIHDVAFNSFQVRKPYGLRFDITTLNSSVMST
jgi:hypothetical protein